MQRSLFDTADPGRGAYGQPIPPTVHNVDPSSSIEADREHRASGKMGRNLMLAVEAVRRWPDRTASELLKLIERECPTSPLLATWELRRRLSDGVRQKPPWLVVGDERPSAVTGRKEQTYRVAGGR